MRTMRAIGLMTIGVACLLTVLFVNPLSAQVATATLSGTVTDATGAVLPGVTVTVKNVDTGASRTAVTDHHGSYYEPNLGLGAWEVRAELSGFQAEIRQGITLTIGRHAVVDFKLKIGDIKEEVTVTGEAPLVDTRSASVGGLVEQQQIQQLPLSGRSYGELTRLIPGVVRGQGSANFQGGFTDNISMRGARVESNKILLDGTDIQGVDNKLPGGVNGLTLGVDAVREFKVEVGTFSAEYGRALGGVINVSTKSGTNQFRGNAFEFHRNAGLDAKNFFDEEKADFVRNQFGFSLGGPIVKDRTHFFGNVEALREKLGVTQIALVPNAAAHQGFLPNAAGQLVNVGVNPLVKPYLDLYPLPNGRDFGDGRAEYLAEGAQPTNQNFFSTRIDQRFSDNDSIFARFTYDDANRLGTGDLDFAFIRERQRSRNQFLTIEEQKLLSSTLFNTARFGFARNFKTLTPAEVSGPGADAPDSLGFVPGFRVWDSTIMVSGLSDLGLADRPRTWATNKFQFSDQIVWRVDKHAIKIGAEVIRFQQNIDQNSNNGGEYDFASGGLQALLQGRPARFRARLPNSDQSRRIRTTYVGWYFQDDFTIKPRLTLNLGLRHEILTGPRDTKNRCPNVLDMYSATPNTDCPLFPTFDKNFAPRLGFAWDISGDGSTALRGGAGLYYSELSASSYYTSITNQPPMTMIADVRNPRFPMAFEDILKGTPRLRANPNGFTATPSTMQFSLTLQHELASKTVASIGYAGSRGRNWIRRGEENVAQWVTLPDGRKYFPAGAPRLSPHWTQILKVKTDQDGSTYDGLLFELRRRFSESFSLQGTYSFSKAIDTAPFVSRENVMDFYDKTRDMGLSDNDVRNNLSVAGIWLIPGPTTGASGVLLGGWQLSGILQASSGHPISASVGYNISRDQMQQIIERPNLVPGKSSNPVLGGPDQYFDPTSFELQEPGFYGNLGRNTLIGPGFVSVDFSLTKNFAMGGQKSLQFRAELFNVLNRANFGVPLAVVYIPSGRDPSAGRIVNTAGSARQIQIGLKYYF